MIRKRKDEFLQIMKNKSKLFHIALSSVLVVLIGIADSLSGPEVSLSVFYLIPVFLTSFYVGLTAGILTSLGCIITYVVADRIIEISYSKAATPYWNSAVRLFLFMIVAYFLAKRKIAEQKLSESEERFRLLVEGVRDYAIIMLDVHGCIESWNSGAERIFGYTNNEISGKHFSCFYAPSAESIKPDNLLHEASNHDVSTYEGCCVRKNGTFWCDIVITALHDKANHLRGFSLLTRDTTERRKAEDAVRMYAELHQIDRAILEAASSEQLAHEALVRIRKLIHFHRASISLIDADLEGATLLALISPERFEINPGEILVLEPEVAKDFELLAAGKVLSFQDAANLDASSLFGQIHSKGINCSYFVPLISRGKLIGALFLGMQRAINSDQLKIAREVADQLAVALHNTLLYEQIRNAHLQMQTLSHCLIQVQESERRHLARELHDEMGQALTAVKIHLQQIEGISHDDSVLSDVRESIAIIEKIVNQVRILSIDLRPLLLDDLGLIATLRWYVSRQSQLGGFSSHFNAEPDQMNLPPDLETACFRIVQEAVTNIIRHAHAKKVQVELVQSEEELQLLVRDDGKGFDVDAAQKRSAGGLSMGLLGMRERVALLDGKLEIESVSAYGTEIRVRFPLKSRMETVV